MKPQNLFLVFSLLILTGCGGKSKFEGTWEGTQIEPDAPSHYQNALKVKLDLLPGAETKLYRLGFTWKGTWKEDERGIELTLTEALGRPATSPVVVRLQPKGDELLLNDDYTQGKEPVSLKRATPTSTPRKD